MSFFYKKEKLIAVATEYLQKEDIDKLLSSITNERDKLLVRILYESGCTLSEITELKTNALHTDGTIQFSDRRANISPELAQELIKQAATHIFHTRQTPTITAKRIQQILKPYIANVHKGKTTPHILRYSHVIHAYKAGIPLQ